MGRWSNGQWTVSTHKASILDSAAMDSVEQKLGIPMPEMVFGNNVLEIRHEPSQFAVVFDAVSALDGVDKNGQGPTKLLQVAHSAKWKASKQKHHRESPPTPGQIDYDVDRVHRPFDWTYTTEYRGTMSLDAPRVESSGIPYQELRKPDPIVFFDEVQLYEDELGDFGLTTYSAKIRVMPQNLFVLARMYMRVDDVAFRIRDTRVFVDFESNRVIREYTQKESSFADVKSKIPVWAEDHSQLLRDANWLNEVLDLQMKEIDEFKLSANEALEPSS